MPFILSKQNTTTTDNKRKTGVMRSNQKNIRYGNEIYLVKLIFLSCSGVAFCTSSYPQNHPEESVFFFFFFLKGNFINNTFLHKLERSIDLYFRVSYVAEMSAEN